MITNGDHEESLECAVSTVWYHLGNAAGDMLQAWSGAEGVGKDGFSST